MFVTVTAASRWGWAELSVRPASGQLGRRNAPGHHRPGDRWAGRGQPVHRLSPLPGAASYHFHWCESSSPSQVSPLWGPVPPCVGTRLEEIWGGCCRQTSLHRVGGGVCGCLCAGTRGRDVPERREPQKGDPLDPWLTPDVCRACGCEGPGQRTTVGSRFQQLHCRVTVLGLRRKVRELVNISGFPVRP